MGVGGGGSGMVFGGEMGSGGGEEKFGRGFYKP